VYSMLGVPKDLYTPIFAMARVAGWAAHRMEELYGAGRIIRPAYRSVFDMRDYAPLAERDASAAGEDAADEKGAAAEKGAGAGGAADAR